MRYEGKLGPLGMVKRIYGSRVNKFSLSVKGHFHE